MDHEEIKKSYPLARSYPNIPVEQYTDALKDSESEVDFSELSELAKSTGEDWEREGFKTTRSYIDLSGNLILVARQTDDSSMFCRLSINGNIIDIPLALHGDDFRADLAGGKRRFYHNKQNVYDASKADSQSDIPLELWPIIEKFGERLYEDEIEPDKWLLHSGNPYAASGYALDIMQQEADQMKQDEEQKAAFTKRRGQISHQRAWKVMQDVKPEPHEESTPESRAGYKERKKQAYRTELKRQIALSDDHFQ